MRSGLLALMLIAATASAEPSIDATFENAVLYGTSTEVSALLDRHPQWVRAHDKHGFTALHLVMCEEKLDTMTLLVRRGADVHARNDEGFTPLHLACGAHAVDTLAGLGAKIDARADNGDTPLLTAAKEADRADVAAALLRHGADPNARDRRGISALALAIERQDEDMQRVLKRAGAKP